MHKPKLNISTTELSTYSKTYTVLLIWQIK